MKRIRSTVSYTVPNWNFCNNDNLINGGELTKNVCRFCVKTKSGYMCVLHDRALSTDGKLIEKVNECKRASAGYDSVIEERHVAPDGPTVSPRELMIETIKIYNKTVNDLLKQGYPRQLAEKVAEKHTIGGK